jgi:hypothetical protein
MRDEGGEPKAKGKRGKGKVDGVESRFSFLVS